MRSKGHQGSNFCTKGKDFFVSGIESKFTSQSPSVAAGSDLPGAGERGMFKEWQQHGPLYLNKIDPELYQGGMLKTHNRNCSLALVLTSLNTFCFRNVALNTLLIPLQFQPD